MNWDYATRILRVAGGDADSTGELDKVYEAGWEPFMQSSCVDECGRPTIFVTLKRPLPCPTTSG